MSSGGSLTKKHNVKKLFDIQEMFINVNLIMYNDSMEILVVLIGNEKENN